MIEFEGRKKNLSGNLSQAMDRKKTPNHIEVSDKLKKKDFNKSFRIMHDGKKLIMKNV